jgi:8-oxo-dGTP pyrophosphatase MutT (NUDIX family)
MEVQEKAGGIVLNNLGEVLIVTNGGTNIAVFPKGGLEPGETPEQAAKREIMEEAGIEAVIVRDLGVITRQGYTATKQDVPSVIKNIRMYLCISDGLELSPRDSSISKAEWVRPDEVTNVLGWPEEKAFFVKHFALRFPC